MNIETIYYFFFCKTKLNILQLYSVSGNRKHLKNILANNIILALYVEKF